MAPPRRSNIWLHFIYGKERAQCKYCVQALSTKSGSLGNLNRHLRTKHPEVPLNNEKHSTLSTVYLKRCSPPQIQDKDENNSEAEIDQLEDQEATIHLVRQMRPDSRGSDEEWLEEETYQTLEVEPPKKVKYRKIKRETQSPPPRRLSFKPKSVIYQKPEKIIYDDNQAKDECAIFGEYVANKLRNVKFPKTRGNLQQLITTILWQAEYGIYDNADAVKRVLAYNLNDVNNGNDQTQSQINIEDGNQTTQECVNS